MGGKFSGNANIKIKNILPSKEDASQTLISSDSYQWISDARCPNCNSQVGYYTKGEKTQHTCTACGKLVTIPNKWGFSS